MVTGFLTVILAIVSVLMVFLIMLQEGKGGGMAALGGTKAAQIEGVTNPIRRATVMMAIIFFIIAVTLGLFNRPKITSVPFDEDKPTPEAGAVGALNPTTVVTPTPAGPVSPVAPVAPAVKVETKAEAAKTPEAPKADAPKADAPKTPEAPKAPDAQKAPETK